MAKRKSKTEAIRQHFAKHAHKPVKDIAKDLTVQPNLVYQVKANLKVRKGRQQPPREVVRKRLKVSLLVSLYPR